MISALFPDVVNCMQTDNLELKKLVYLYLMNYAKSQPDMAIMAVNTFVKVLCGPLNKFFFCYCCFFSFVLCIGFIAEFLYTSRSLAIAVVNDVFWLNNISRRLC